MEPLDYLRAHPDASRKQVMKACGCSARAGRRAEEALSLEQGRAPRALWKKMVAVALLVAGGAAVALWPSAPASAGKEPVSERVRAEEAAIYSALDLRDRAQAPQISKHLESEEEQLRLAALRFLTRVDPEPYLEQLVPLVDDESSRVRQAAVQLLGGVATSEAVGQRGVTEALLRVLGDEERALSERVLAVHGLRKRKPREVRQALPALEDPRLERQVAALLSTWTGKDVAPAGDESLRDAWERALGAGT